MIMETDRGKAIAGLVKGDGDRWILSKFKRLRVQFTRNEDGKFRCIVNLNFLV